MITDKEFQILQEIVQKENLGEISSVKKLNSGFSRIVFEINNNYIVKITFDIQRLRNVLNEVNFYQNNAKDYATKFIAFENKFDKDNYAYTVENKINGNSLFVNWTTASLDKKMDYLNQLTDILKDIHSKRPHKQDCCENYINWYNSFLQNAIDNKVLTYEQIEYIKRLLDYIYKYLAYGRTGMIHGDVHFNNIIVESEKLKIYDFENYEENFLDKDFDSLFRMMRNPQSYIKRNDTFLYDFKDLSYIRDHIESSYKELSNAPYYEERIIAYDVLNSLRWIAQYPKYHLYHQVLFEDSKKLIRK